MKYIRPQFTSQGKRGKKLHGTSPVSADERLVPDVYRKPGGVVTPKFAYYTPQADKLQRYSPTLAQDEDLHKLSCLPDPIDSARQVHEDYSVGEALPRACGVWPRELSTGNFFLVDPRAG